MHRHPLERTLTFQSHVLKTQKIASENCNEVHIIKQAFKCKNLTTLLSNKHVARYVHIHNGQIRLLNNSPLSLFLIVSGLSFSMSHSTPSLAKLFSSIS